MNNNSHIFVGAIARDEKEPAIKQNTKLVNNRDRGVNVEYLSIIMNCLYV